MDKYINGYSDVSVHHLMLKDDERTRSYMEAIENCRELFENKIVLDVGCGTGILSLFAARNGAKRVYAIECSETFYLAKRIVEDNGMSSKIQVIYGIIEEVELPIKKVDIIVSEWMGFYLLHEGMLDSVIYARDKWLDRSNGLIFPCLATIYISLANISEFWNTNFESFDNFYGFDFSALKKTLLSTYLNVPSIISISDEAVRNSSVEKVFFLNLYKINRQDLDDLKRVVIIKVTDTIEQVHGFAFWFDVQFPSKSETERNMQRNEAQILCNYDQLILNTELCCYKEAVVLSTSPYSKATHWKQSILLLHSPLKANKNLNLTCKVSMNRNRNESHRFYSISVDVIDTNE
ncbi:arginine N-methyltransferase protein, putative [Cryptosporidium muris RN66]|uniref:type I protein arginine methyltransferase n=1 Tax=Cryptosporidium muris (strain RN66) TaxID=441375 RepID=B6AC40_CRYMR|nr:arginine N-methyltransferase protein, putative [Cryptosporidium muris RN66]EEA05393.1 arginine N-methyltranferase protein, putative [Cryptosporidium muris RN66]|eukprot:XP_002139742.1 arginine N-methyltranferase protein [Cryptosporidium muris RN66]